jgi:SWIM zinc finger
VSITISADDLRTIRALEIAATADQWQTSRTPTGELAYRIPSQTDPEHSYLVTSTSCECPDFLRGGGPAAIKPEDAAEPRPCKHILAVRLFDELVRAQRNLDRPASQRRRDR